MNTWVALTVGWTLTLGAIGFYAMWLAVRSRQLGTELGLGSDRDAEHG